MIILSVTIQLLPIMIATEQPFLYFVVQYLDLSINKKNDCIIGSFSYFSSEIRLCQYIILNVSCQHRNIFDIWESEPIENQYLPEISLSKSIKNHAASLKTFPRRSYYLRFKKQIMVFIYITMIANFFYPTSFLLLPVLNLR